MRRNRALLWAVLAAACWSTSGLFVTFILEGSAWSVWQMAFWREATTLGLLLVGVAAIRPSLLRARWRDMPWLAGMGASMGVLHLSWNASIMENGVAVATVFQYNSPILVALAAWLLWREPLTGRKLAAVALAVTGTAFLARLGRLEGAQISGMGAAAGVGTAVSYSIYSLCGKRLAGDYNPWTINVYVFLFATLLLSPIPFSAPGGGALSPLAALSLLGVALFTTLLGYALYTLSLRGLQASVAVIVSTAEVPFAAMLSFLILGQRLDGGQVWGATMVIVSVVLLSWPARREERDWSLEIGD